MIKESERLTRLINQVLDLAKIESGLAEWRTAELDLREIVLEAVNATSAIFNVAGRAHRDARWPPRCRSSWPTATA